MNKKLNLTGPADLLAAVPHLLGTKPTESFVVLTARAGALGATLRVDAPEHAVPAFFMPGPLPGLAATKRRPRGC